MTNASAPCPNYVFETSMMEVVGGGALLAWPFCALRPTNTTAAGTSGATTVAADAAVVALMLRGMPLALLVMPPMVDTDANDAGGTDAVTETANGTASPAVDDDAGDE